MSIPQDVITLVEESGNSFHASVARWFQAQGWQIAVSPYYLDQTQAKAREIDLVAEKRWPVESSLGRAEGYLTVRLFIECKYIANNTVFWFAPKNQREAKALVCASGVFYESSSYTDDHHYLATSPNVAKLFASNNSKASENEPIYKAVNQVLNGTVAMRWRTSAVGGSSSRRSISLYQLQFPVIVCNSFDRLFRVDFLAESQPEALKDNFQLEVQYAYADRDGTVRDDYFLIDCVEYAQLASFAAALDRDARAASALAARA